MNWHGLGIAVETISSVYTLIIIACELWAYYRKQSHVKGLWDATLVIAVLSTFMINWATEFYWPVQIGVAICWGLIIYEDATNKNPWEASNKLQKVIVWVDGLRRKL